MKKFGFIGIGAMGYPMLCGAIQAFGQDQVTYTSATLEHMQKVKETTGVDYIEKLDDLIPICQFLVLAIKPQQLERVINQLKGKLKQDQIVISPVVSVTIHDMKQYLGTNNRIVRIMPNTPAMVGEGMTELCYSEDEFTKEEQDSVEKLMTSFGRFRIIPETLMDAAVCASGSSPAYVYLFIEALADSVVKYGVPRETAYELAAQTVLGAAKMVLETKLHPGALKDAVCSPGGTTIAGVLELERFGFRNAVISATDACYQRAIYLKEGVSSNGKVQPKG